MIRKTSASLLVLSSIALLLLAFLYVGASAKGDQESRLAGPAIVHATLSALYFMRLARVKSRSTAVWTFFGAFEFLRGSVVPLLILYVGQDPVPYRDYGSYSSAEKVLWVGVIYFAAVFLFSFFAMRSKTPSSKLTSPVGGRSLRTGVTDRVIVILMCLGILGLVLRFPSVDSLWSFVTIEDYRVLQSAGQDVQSGIAQLTSNLLRPMLPLAIALLLVRRREKSGKLSFLLIIVLLIVSYFSLGSYGLNRATLLIPLIGVLASYIIYFDIEIKFRRIVWVSLLAGLAFIQIGSFRSELFAPSGAYVAEGSWLRTTVQTVLLYGQSPLQTAIIFDGSYWPGGTVIASILSPIPGIGEVWRNDTGTAFYNQLIYGNSLTRDQILLSWLEVFLSSNIVGLLLFAVILVVAFKTVQVIHDRASSFVSIYASVLLIAFASQVSITSINAFIQSFIYLVLVPLSLSFLDGARSDKHATLVLGRSSDCG